MTDVSLTWSCPSTRGIPPTPRFGHTMTAIGKYLYVFGGSDGKRSFNTLFILDVDSLIWTQPPCAGTPPSTRSKHCAVPLKNDSLFVWGGIGGGNEIYLLETASLTWHIPPSNGTAPSPRYGHSGILVDQSIFIVGGHDGRKVVDDVWELDIVTMTWFPTTLTGKAPTVDPKHAAINIPGTDRILVIGGSDQGTFRELFMFERSHARWQIVDSDGKEPPTRTRYSTLVVDSNVFVFAGMGAGRPLNDVYVLSLDDLSWTEPKIGGYAPPPRMDHAMALVQDRHGTRMFIFGGHDGQQPLNDFYSLVTMTWSRITQNGSAPSARIGHTLTLVGQRLFLLGGATDGNTHKDVRVFDLELNEWHVPHVTGSPPNALVAHSCVLVGNELFVLGGGDGVHTANPLMVLDLDSLAWEEPSVEGRGPFGNYGHSACMYMRSMFVFGGYSQQFGYRNDVFALDTAMMSWSTPHINGTPPTPRVGHSMAISGSTMFIYGGSNRKRIYGDIHALNCASMTWTELKPVTDPSRFPSPRFNHSSCAIGPKIFILGGIVSKSSSHLNHKEQVSKGHWRPHKGSQYATDELFVFSSDTRQWEQPKVAGVRPGPRFRHAVQVLDSQMILYGGSKGGTEIWSLDTGLVTQASFKPKGGFSSEQANESIVDWLRQLGLEKYSRAFIKAEVDLASISQLTEADLDSMGIIALGPRKKLLMSIANRRRADEKDHTPASADLYQRRYRLEGVIRFGGGSTVKLATDMKVGKKVALKFVPDLEEFLNEVKMLKLLHSEFVVEMLDYYEDATRGNCIVLEYASRSLSDYLKVEKLGRNTRKYIMERICRIVHHLHAKNIAHLDLKPSNVCLFGLNWKLIDLGSARKAGDIVPPTMTPLYCSPETAKAIAKQNIGSLPASTSMDIWALGLMFVEMFTGQPFLRVDRVDGIQQVQTYNEIAIPSNMIDDVQARHLLTKMLHKVPMERANIVAVLRHAFFTGGMDTEQLQEAFDFLGHAETDLERSVQNVYAQLAAKRSAEEQLRTASAGAQ